jgi:cell division protein ZipA
MDNMRWLLLLAGIIVILIVYIFTRLQGRHREQAGIIEQDGSDNDGYDPLFDAPDQDRIVEQELERLEQLITGDQSGRKTRLRAGQRQQQPGPKGGVVEQAGKVVTLFVLAADGAPFSGNLIKNAMNKTGLHFGDMDIFHHYENVDGIDKTIFAVANMMEPGTFDFHAMKTFSTPGLVLFLQLPAAVDAVSAFDEMVKTARNLSVHLEGSVRDATHSVLSNQTVGHLREDVIDYQLRQRVAQSAI